MVGALLAMFVLGAFALAVVVVLTLNLRQTPLEPEPIYKPVPDYRIGGDAL